MGRTNSISPCQPSRGKEYRWRRALAGIDVFINKLKLISLFTGSGLQDVARLKASSMSQARHRGGCVG